MKKAFTISIIICLIIIFTGCVFKSGSVEGYQVEIGESSKFSESEIKTAIECVIDYFPNFEGCELQKLWYDEERSDAFLDDSDSANTIVLLSFLRVDDSGGDGSFNPDSTYDNWKWILKRDDNNSKWELKDWGY